MTESLRSASEVPLGDGARARRYLVPLLVVVLFGVALRVLHEDAAHLRYHDVMRAFAEVPRRQILLALFATVVSYAVLPGYDVLALAYAGHRLPKRRIAYGAMVTYGVSQTLGFPALTGGSLRVRLWSSWGLGTTEITRAVAFAAATFTLGLATLAGIVGLLEPAASLARLHLPVLPVRLLAAASVIATLAYVAWSVIAHDRSIRIGRWELAVPSPRLVAGQLLVAALDWTVAATVLFVLLPQGAGVRFSAFVGAFLLSQSAGLLSHVPGGLGVFESLILLQIGDAAPTEQLLGSLLAYRVVFYLVPFATALVLLAVHELRRQRASLRRAAAVVTGTFERWGEPLLPTAMGTMTMVGGAMLLLSGSTPSLRGRMTILAEVLPLGVVELSHFAGSVAGAGLVVLGWAITRRLDAGFHLARILLMVGIVASLLKGLDYEEAVALAIVLGLLTASKDAFYRRSSLLAEPLTPSWVAAILAIVAVSVWVGLFSYKHVEFASDIWWRFTQRGDAPRFLRASAGAVACLGFLAAARLLRAATPQVDGPDPAQLQRVAAILPRVEDTSAALALLGDKHLLFPERGVGFLMYAISGRTWVALGDPIGDPSIRRELAWRFRELADAHDAWPVFYEVSQEHLPLYIDLGLTLLKMGEEAIVPLETFSLDGGARRGLRRTQRDLQKAGATFEVVDAAQIAPLFPTLRAISDEWLGAKATREKGFSLGRFDEDYLSHFPHAVVRVDGTIVAFANLWTGNGQELSVDLMRYSSSAPSGVMEYLFIELMLWGRANGFARMSLGMAPLSGFETHALAPRWQRFGGLLYRHGEHFYNFQGLRRYKEKFDPVWQPRYLASPAGLALPRVLANIATLISGGIAGLVSR